MTFWLLSFEQWPWFFATMATLLGLLCGSFLNVVIHRLPIMMERQWLADCAETLEQPLPKSDLPEKYNLLVPRSACPQCGAGISALRNIPVISYMFLGGKCGECSSPISIRYPLVELFTGLISGYLAWHFGPTIQFLAAWIMCLCLIALTGIDVDKMLLPDSITLPLLWLGLLINIEALFVPLSDAVVGAALGYLSLWSIFHVFRILTGKHGMGFGDFKLFAMFGAWFGYSALLPIILIASFSGAAFGIAQMVSGKLKQGNPMPFGPWIALGGVIYLLWGEQLVKW